MRYPRPTCDEPLLLKGSQAWSRGRSRGACPRNAPAPCWWSVFVAALALPQREKNTRRKRLTKGRGGGRAKTTVLGKLGGRRVLIAHHLLLLLRSFSVTCGSPPSVGCRESCTALAIETCSGRKPPCPCGCDGATGGFPFPFVADVGPSCPLRAKQPPSRERMVVKRADDASKSSELLFRVSEGPCRSKRAPIGRCGCYLLCRRRFFFFSREPRTSTHARDLRYMCCTKRSAVGELLRGGACAREKRRGRVGTACCKVAVDSFVGERLVLHQLYCIFMRFFVVACTR